MRYSRREFIGRAAALPFALRGLAAGQSTSGLKWVLLGTDTGEGIYRAPWDVATGSLGPLQLAADVVRPTYMAKHPSLPVLYSLEEGTGDKAAVSSFQVNAPTAGLTRINRVGSQGDGPCYVSVDHTGSTVFVANYAGGSFAAIRLAKTGAMSDVLGVYKGSLEQPGPVAERQEASHIHCATIDPHNGHVLACDLGADAILVFPVAPANNKLVPVRVAARAGSGPRHVAFHPNGRWVYCIHELDATIDLYDWRVHNGPVMKLRENSVVSTLEKGVDLKGNTGCEIVVSDDGRFLYSCTRGVDTIEVWRIDATTGLLTLQQRVSTGGKIPRYFALDPTRKWLVCCNQGAPGNVTVFAHDASTGRLSEKPKTFAAPTPMFVTWV